MISNPFNLLICLVPALTFWISPSTSQAEEKLRYRFEIRGPSEKRPNENVKWGISYDSSSEAEKQRKLIWDSYHGGLRDGSTDKPTKLKVVKVSYKVSEFSQEKPRPTNEVELRGAKNGIVPGTPSKSQITPGLLTREWEIWLEMKVNGEWVPVKDRKWKKNDGEAEVFLAKIRSMVETRNNRNESNGDPQRYRVQTTSRYRPKPSLKSTFKPLGTLELSKTQTKPLAAQPKNSVANPVEPFSSLANTFWKNEKVEPAYDSYRPGRVGDKWRELAIFEDGTFHRVFVRKLYSSPGAGTQSVHSGIWDSKTGATETQKSWLGKTGWRKHTGKGSVRLEGNKLVAYDYKGVRRQTYTRIPKLSVRKIE